MTVLKVLSKGSGIGFDDCPECHKRHIGQFFKERAPGKDLFEASLAPFYFTCPNTKQKVFFELTVKIIPGRDEEGLSTEEIT